jgi:hypothetical protein
MTVYVVPLSAWWSLTEAEQGFLLTRRHVLVGGFTLELPAFVAAGFDVVGQQVALDGGSVVAIGCRDRQGVLPPWVEAFVYLTPEEWRQSAHSPHRARAAA